jgi:hypothetical protein
MSTRVTLKDGSEILTEAAAEPLRVLVVEDGPGQVELPTATEPVTVRIRQIAAVDGIAA